MVINLDYTQELRVSVNADNSCIVDFCECGKRLGTETWRSLEDVLAEYCE